MSNLGSCLTVDKTTFLRVESRVCVQRNAGISSAKVSLTVYHTMPEEPIVGLYCKSNIESLIFFPRFTLTKIRGSEYDLKFHSRTSGKYTLRNCFIIQ